MMDERECEYEDGWQVYECEFCFHRIEEEKCSCVDGEINVNCTECF